MGSRYSSSLCCSVQCVTAGPALQLQKYSVLSCVFCLKQLTQAIKFELSAVVLGSPPHTPPPPFLFCLRAVRSLWVLFGGWCVGEARGRALGVILQTLPTYSETRSLIGLELAEW